MDKVAARLTIYDASDMTVKGSKQILKWIMRQAKDFVENRSEYSSRYTARYCYSVNKKRSVKR